MAAGDIAIAYETVSGVPAARVVVLGGGIVGPNVARMAMGLEASVTVIDKSPPRLYDLDPQFGPILNTIFPQHDLPSTRSSRPSIRSKSRCSTPISTSSRCWLPAARRPAS